MARTTPLPWRLTSCRAYVPLLSVCLLISCLPAGASSMWACVDQVSVPSYTNFLSNMLQTHLGDNRGPAGVDHNPVRDAIASQLQNYGLLTSIEHGTYAGLSYDNVVAVHQGTVRPDEVYIVAAHYDSVNNPGADDNASGVAGMLETARILSQYRSDATIVFIAFDREEDGLIGSYGYVGTHPQNVRGMLALDMIAYNPVGAGHNAAYIYGRNASDPWRTNAALAIGTYGGLATTVGGDLPYSDHAPFEAAGYDAALLIERNWATNPNYHRLTDSVDTPNYIDYQYASNMTRGAVGLLSGEAGTYAPEPGTLVLSSIALLGLITRVRARRRQAAADTQSDAA